MKCLVYGIYFLQFVQSILALYTGFRTFVTGFGNVQALDQVDMAWLSTPILTAICELSRLKTSLVDVLTSHQGTLFVQGFYAHRISLLAKSKKIAGVIITVSL